MVPEIPFTIKHSMKKFPPGMMKPSEWANMYMPQKINEEAAAFLDQEAYYCEIPRGRVILRAGQRLPYLLTPLQGVCRGYLVEDNFEITTWFAPENYLIADLRSIISEQLSLQNIQCLEDCVLLGVQVDALRNWMWKYESAHEAGRLILNHFIDMERERTIMSSLPLASTRYLKFLELMPQLKDRVSQKYKASFLNMTTETLSRIKSKLKYEEADESLGFNQHQ